MISHGDRHAERYDGENLAIYVQNTAMPGVRTLNVRCSLVDEPIKMKMNKTVTDLGSKRAVATATKKAEET